MAEFRGEGDAKNIPPEFEETILRLTQESLTNAVRHANAKNFRAVLDVSGNKFQLQLVDDGRGFDPRAEHEGYGLLGMKERVHRIGGEFIIRSKLNVGTEILVHSRLNCRPNRKVAMNKSKKVIRVLVADDHTVVRDGLNAIIKQEEDMDVVAEAGEGRPQNS